MEEDCHPHPSRPGAWFRAVRLLRRVWADERLERKALIRALGWDAELERIRRGLRGGECGARDGLLYRIWEGFGEFKYGDG